MSHNPLKLLFVGGGVVLVAFAVLGLIVVVFIVGPRNLTFKFCQNYVSNSWYIVVVVVVFVCVVVFVVAVVFVVIDIDFKIWSTSG